VSVAVGHEQRTGRMAQREVISSLDAWDTARNSSVRLKPGMVLDSCSVCRDTRADPYFAQFSSEGRIYTCPLFHFLPRTQMVRLVDAEDAELPAPSAAAL
jgi:hypothetical protein